MGAMWDQEKQKHLNMINKGNVETLNASKVATNYKSNEAEFF